MVVFFVAVVVAVVVAAVDVAVDVFVVGGAAVVVGAVDGGWCSSSCC